MANSEFLEIQNNGLSIGLASPSPEFLLTPNIGVIGVGGAGGNAVNNMVESDLGDVAFFAANTDAQALSKSLVADKIQLGVTITQGLGAGANPEIGKAAATEAEEKIKEYLKGLHLLFITAGMGGGTGTGAAPVIAKLAKDMGILTVGVVSKPFQFEGRRRMQTAETGIAELQKYVDTLIVIPNQNLFRIVPNNTTFADAFKIADGVLCQGVRSITDLVMNPGMINLDFADVKTILSFKGRAMMGTAEATGENRAEIAVEQAISNPLLDDSSIQGAKSILINISGGLDLTLAEVDLAAERIRRELQQDDANIVFGTCTDESLHGKIRVSLVATGIDENNSGRYIPSPQVVQEKIVDVPVSSGVDMSGLSIEEETAESPEEEFPLMQEVDQLSAQNPFETNMMYQSGTEQPFGLGLSETIVFDNTNVNPNIAIEITEAPITQPPLFDEEVPQIGAAIPVETMPEEKESINMKTKVVGENVRSPRGISLFDMILPNRNKAAARDKNPQSVAQASNPQATTQAGERGVLFDDSPFKDDLPAFLKQR